MARLGLGRSAATETVKYLYPSQTHADLYQLFSMHPCKPAPSIELVQVCVSPPAHAMETLFPYIEEMAAIHWY